MSDKFSTTSSCSSMLNVLLPQLDDDEDDAPDWPTSQAEKTLGGKHGQQQKCRFFEEQGLFFPWVIIMICCNDDTLVYSVTTYYNSSCILTVLQLQDFGCGRRRRKCRLGLLYARRGRKTFCLHEEHHPLKEGKDSGSSCSIISEEESCRREGGRR